ncbi:MAG: hypothetical protein IV100_12115 [Myxococcales bacterium]|nr:hypothetical protein [Myxococcales bacterium]
MQNVEWQPFVNLIQAAASAAGDVTQDDDFWLDTRAAKVVILTIEMLYASAAGSPDLVIEYSDDPSIGLWHVAWQRSRYDPSNEEGTYLVTLLRQVQVGKPFHLGSSLRWRVTGFATSTDPTEVGFRILATLQ